MNYVHLGIKLFSVNALNMRRLMSETRIRAISSRKHTYINLTPLNPTFI